MKLKARIKLLMFLFIMPITITSYAEEQWEKVKDENGIQVYVRPVAGSPLNEFKGEGVVDFPIQSVDAVIGDFNRATEWMPDCKISSLVEKRTENHVFVYQEMKAPWPVSNRDYVIESIITKSPDKVLRTIKAVEHEAAPAKKGIVRIKEMEGNWIVTKLDENRTHVLYQVKSNPGGDLPSWLANSASQDLPFNTIKMLRRQVIKVTTSK